MKHETKRKMQKEFRVKSFSFSKSNTPGEEVWGE
jgi:hypothetical protein